MVQGSTPETPHRCPQCGAPFHLCECTPRYCEGAAGRLLRARQPSIDPPEIWEGPGEDRCDVLLLSLDHRAMPDHLCLMTARETVRQYSFQHFPSGTIFDDDMFTPVPLPLGPDTLAEFVAACPHSMRVADIAPPFPALIHLPNAWAGLIVQRVLPGGRVTLFGLVERVDQPDYDLPDTWFFRSWQFVQGIPTVEQHDGDKKNRQALERVQKELDDWFRKRIRGLKVYGGGRKPGPPPEFQQIRNAYCEALEDLRRDRITIGVTAVAVGMSSVLNENISRQKLRYWIDQGWLDALPDTSGRKTR